MRRLKSSTGRVARTGGRPGTCDVHARVLDNITDAVVLTPRTAIGGGGAPTDAVSGDRGVTGDLRTRTCHTFPSGIPLGRPACDSDPRHGTITAALRLRDQLRLIYPCGRVCMDHRLRRVVRESEPHAVGITERRKTGLTAVLRCGRHGNACANIITVPPDPVVDGEVHVSGDSGGKSGGKPRRSGPLAGLCRERCVEVRTRRALCHLELRLCSESFVCCRDRRSPGRDALERSRSICGTLEYRNRCGTHRPTGTAVVHRLCSLRTIAVRVVVRGKVSYSTRLDRVGRRLDRQSRIVTAWSGRVRRITTARAVRDSEVHATSGACLRACRRDDRTRATGGIPGNIDAIYPGTRRERNTVLVGRMRPLQDQGRVVG